MSEKSKSFSMFDFIKDVCDNIGPRFGTTENEAKAGQKIKDILEPLVDEVEIEEFTCHPNGFLDFLKIGLIAAVIGSVVFLWFPLISMFIFIFIILAFFLEHMVLMELLDFFFPKGTAANVVGKLKPTNDARQILICSGHHDSAYEFPLFEKYKSDFGKLVLITIIAIVASILLSLIVSILSITIISDPLSTLLYLIGPIVATILVGYIALNIHSNKVILGANDNLSGVSVMLALAHHFSKNRLKNVELWCVSFACEECMRGSKRFVAKHLDELKDSLTVNFDGVGLGTLSITKAEPDYLTVHSLELAEQYQESSKKAGIELPIETQGFGGTDAALFSKKKLKAISVIGLAKGGYPDTWHEMIDKPDIIKKDQLDRALKITIQYINDLDSKL